MSLRTSSRTLTILLPVSSWVPLSRRSSVPSTRGAPWRSERRTWLIRSPQMTISQLRLFLRRRSHFLRISRNAELRWLRPASRRCTTSQTPRRQPRATRLVSTSRVTTSRSQILISTTKPMLLGSLRALIPFLPWLMEPTSRCLITARWMVVKRILTLTWRKYNPPPPTTRFSVFLLTTPVMRLSTPSPWLFTRLMTRYMNRRRLRPPTCLTLSLTLSMVYVHNLPEIKCILLTNPVLLHIQCLWWDRRQPWYWCSLPQPERRWLQR